MMMNCSFLGGGGGGGGGGCGVIRLFLFLPVVSHFLLFWFKDELKCLQINNYTPACFDAGVPKQRGMGVYIPNNLTPSTSPLQ